MNNWQETLLFPIRDAEARKQFLIACLVTLAGFIIPLIPTLILMGYGVKIMRQVLQERKSPAMPEWQGSNWSEMLLDGLRIFGIQVILTLPLLLIMGCGFFFMISGSIGFAALADESTRAFAPIGGLFYVLGIGIMMVFTLLSIPYGVIISAAIPHAVANNSFEAGFKFKEWFPILRKGLGNFIISYVFVIVISFVLMFAIQFAIITIILICIVPFLMIPYSTYVTLIANTVFSQAYITSLDALKMEQHATA